MGTDQDPEPESHLRVRPTTTRCAGAFPRTVTCDRRCSYAALRCLDLPRPRFVPPILDFVPGRSRQPRGSAALGCLFDCMLLLKPPSAPVPVVCIVLQSLLSEPGSGGLSERTHRPSHSSDLLPTGSRFARMTMTYTRSFRAATGLPMTVLRQRTAVPTRSGLPRQLQPLAPRPRPRVPSSARPSRPMGGSWPRHTRTGRYAGLSTLRAVILRRLPASRQGSQHRCTALSRG